jgi:signal peptidase II
MDDAFGGGALEDQPPAIEVVRAPRRIELWVPALILVADQATKAMVRRALPLHDSVAVIPGFLDFTHIRNSGAAFGFLSGVDFPYKAFFIAVVATCALAGVGIYTMALARDQWLPRLGLSLILGGAAGNLVDRVVVGSVVDFVDVYWRTYHFWAFNVADSAITIGVALMILDMFGVGRHASSTV